MAGVRLWLQSEVLAEVPLERLVLVVESAMVLEEQPALEADRLELIPPIRLAPANPKTKNKTKKNQKKIKSKESQKNKRNFSHRKQSSNFMGRDRYGEIPQYLFVCI